MALPNPLRRAITRPSAARRTRAWVRLGRLALFALVALSTCSACEQRTPAPRARHEGRRRPSAPRPPAAPVLAPAPGAPLGAPWSEDFPQWGPRGRLHSPPLDECSGIVRGRLHPDVYWTHNDSGDSARIFAITSEGLLVGEVRLDDAHHVDWEDITADDAGNLYVADVGNNKSDRRDLVIYVLREPDPRAQAHVPVLRTLRFHYPDQRGFPAVPRDFDCEAVFWRAGRLYLLTKHRDDTRTRLYALDDLQTQADQALRPVDGCDVESQVTGASVSPDGRELAVLSYEFLYLFPLEPGREPSLSHVPARRLLFEARQCEGIAHEGGVLRVVNEQQEIHLLETAAVRRAAAERPATGAAAFTPAAAAPRALARGYVPPRPAAAVRGDAAVSLPLVASSGERDEPAPLPPQSAGARVRVEGGGLRLSLSWDAAPPAESTSGVAGSGAGGGSGTAAGDPGTTPLVVAYLAWGALSDRPAPGPSDQVWAVIEFAGALALRAEFAPRGVTPPSADLRRSGSRIEGAVHLPPVATGGDSEGLAATTALDVVLFAPGGGDWSFGAGWSMRGPLNPFLWGELHP